MKKLLVLALAAIPLLLTSCVSIDSELRSWVGHDSQELLVAWGPPTSTFDDGRGGQVWTYEMARQTMGTAWANQRGQVFYTAPRQYSAVRHFFIDQNGKVYGYRWQGL